MGAINEKIDYGAVLLGSIDLTQEPKTSESKEYKESTTQENDKSRTKEQKNKRTKESKKTRNKEAKSSRVAVNITMVDDTIMAIRKKAIKMKVKTWMLIDDALQKYLNDYKAEDKETHKTRHQEIKKSCKKRHPANITLAEETKTAIWLLALKENVSPWVLIEEALSLFLEDKKSRNQEVR